jgi:hypothetical protein
MTEQLGDKDVAAEIERIVDAACDEAREKDFEESINYADLCCVDVAMSLRTQNYLVYIEEASPDCPKFQQYVYDLLEKAGYTNVEIRTEW